MDRFLLEIAYSSKPKEIHLMVPWYLLSFFGGTCNVLLMKNAHYKNAFKKFLGFNFNVAKPNFILLWLKM